MHHLRFPYFSSYVCIFFTAISFTASMGSSRALVLNGDSSKTYTFALVVKTVQNPFFLTLLDGWESVMKQYDNVEYVYLGPESEEHPDSADIQASLMDDLIEQQGHGGVNGIAVSALDPIIGENINKAIDAGIPTITVDSDVAESQRLTFVGPDNHALGSYTGKILMQLNPEGGKYCVVSLDSPNLDQRVEGARERLKDSNWIEADISPHEGTLEAMTHASNLDADISAILTMGGWLTYNPTAWVSFIEKQNVTTVHVDASDAQLLLLKQGYIDGVVGQLPYEMGQVSAQVLLDITSGALPKEEILSTHLLEFVRVPLVLPELIVDMNYLCNLAILGYVLFALVAIMTFGACAWTVRYRESRVVKASQPLFLFMICTGVLIMGSAIIPVTVDDERYSERGCDVACMSIPWLFSIGFTTTLSALFSKTWRINKLYRHASRFRRVTVTEQDVLVPYFVLMACNVVILVCWTALAPLQYVRTAEGGTDGWNRVIATYGTCTTETSAVGGEIPYMVCLAVTNLAALVIANFQAYKARQIHTEFAESRYVAIIMACLLQAFVLGVPILVLVWNQPTANFVVMTLLDFLVCSTIMLFMFGPKVQYLIKTKNEPPAVRRGSSVVFGSQGNQSRTSATMQTLHREVSSSSVMDGNARRRSVRFGSEPSFAPESVHLSSSSHVGTVMTMLTSMPKDDKRLVLENLGRELNVELDLEPNTEVIGPVATEVGCDHILHRNREADMPNSEAAENGSAGGTTVEANHEVAVTTTVIGGKYKGTED